MVLLCGAFFVRQELQPLWRNETEVKAQHQDEKEHYGKSDAHGKSLDGAFGSTFVLDQVIQRGTEAEEDDGNEQEDDDSHAAFPREKFSVDDSSLGCQQRCFLVLNSSLGYGLASQPERCCY